MTAMPEKLSNDLIGNVGEYYVCHVLSQWGIQALMTRKDAKRADVIAYCEDTLRKAAIQVKTYTSTGQTLVCGRTEGCGAADDPIFDEKPIADFWALILLDKRTRAVKSVHIWDSKDKSCLIEGSGDGKSVWRIDPNGKEGNIRKWDDCKDEKGWRLLVDFLKSKKNHPKNGEGGAKKTAIALIAAAAVAAVAVLGSFLCLACATAA